MTTAADPWDALADANLTHDLPPEQHAWAECQCAPCTSRTVPSQGAESRGTSTESPGEAIAVLVGSARAVEKGAKFLDLSFETQLAAAETARRFERELSLYLGGSR